MTEKDVSKAWVRLPIDRLVIEPSTKPRVISYRDRLASPGYKGYKRVASRPRAASPVPWHVGFRALICLGDDHPLLRIHFTGGLNIANYRPTGVSSIQLIQRRCGLLVVVTSIRIACRFNIDSSKASRVNARHGGAPVIMERLSGLTWKIVPASTDSLQRATRAVCRASAAHA